MIIYGHGESRIPEDTRTVAGVCLEEDTERCRQDLSGPGVEGLHEGRYVCPRRWSGSGP